MLVIVNTLVIVKVGDSRALLALKDGNQIVAKDLVDSVGFMFSILCKFLLL